METPHFRESTIVALLLAGAFVLILNQTLMIAAVPADYEGNECYGEQCTVANDCFYAC